MENSADILARLQHDQREHDLRAHKDIVYLPYPSRIRHLTFHVAKYSGRLAANPSPADMGKTIVDAFIICLSAAEVLNISFSREFGSLTAVYGYRDLGALGRALNPGAADPGNVAEWYFRQLALVGGRMAKACESLDHMEPIPYREMLSSAIIELARASLVTAGRLGIDLEVSVRQRWEEIESRSIL